MPLCLNSFKKDGEWLIAMEDLSSVGLNCTSENATKNHLKTSLSWLANFHAKYMGICSDHIWRVGTYWHLDTRPDELEALEDQELKISAKKIDNLLNNSKYQTIVHGDAKLANFCFNTDATECGAVDFQYVGHGSGIKDVMYFMSSAIKPENSQMMQEWILEYYFSELKKSLNYYDKNYCYKEVEQEYRKMFEVAWADFYRFIMGWSPNHFKANAYSKALTQKVLRSLK
jgi:glycine betaine/choline ABC-type transport system substrate-binding protein